MKFEPVLVAHQWTLWDCSVEVWAIRETESGRLLGLLEDTYDPESGEPKEPALELTKKFAGELARRLNEA